jgi:WD40 repeat protein
MLVARAATRDARGVTPCRASRSRRRWTLAPRARHVVARGVSFASDDDAHIHLSVVARVPDAHAGAVLALAAVDDPDPDARFPWFVSTSVDGTVSTWHVEERAGGELELVRDASFGDDDAPWWCLAVDEEWLFAGTHGRKVKVRLAVDADLEKLPGAIANHTGWVRALASVRKTPNELERARRSPRLPGASATGPEDDTRNVFSPPTFGNAWRFSAACNVVRVWHDSFAFDEDDEMGDVGDDALSSAVVDVGETKIFTGDVLCLAGFQTATRSPNGSSRFLIAGVADGTVRGWRVVESPDTSKPSNAPVMVPITKRFVETNGGRVQTLFALAEVFPKDDLMSRLVVFGCRDGTLGLVDAETLVASPARVKAHTLEDAFEEKQKQKASGVACLCAGPKNTVASGGDDGIVRLWRAKKRRLSESEKTNDVLSTTGSNSGGDVANVTCVSLEPAGGTRERTGDDGDDVPSPNARGEEEGEKTEKKSAGTRCLCAVRDASGARVGVLAGDRAGGLTLYVAASSQ